MSVLLLGVAAVVLSQQPVFLSKMSLGGSGVGRLAASKDGSQMYVSHGSTLRVVDVADKYLLRVEHEHTMASSIVSLLTIGADTVAAACDAGLSVMDVSAAPTETKLFASTAPYNAINYHSKKKFVFATGSGTGLQRLDMATGLTQTLQPSSKFSNGRTLNTQDTDYLLAGIGKQILSYYIRNDADTIDEYSIAEDVTAASRVMLALSKGNQGSFLATSLGSGGLHYGRIWAAGIYAAVILAPPTPSNWDRLAIYSPYVYVTDLTNKNMKVVDVSDETKPVLVLDDITNDEGAVFLDILTIGSTLYALVEGGHVYVYALGDVPPRRTPAPPTEAPPTVAPPTPSPPTPAPPTPSPPTPAPATPSPPTPAPLTPAPETAAPPTMAPPTPAPATSAPLTPAPATSAPPTSSPPTSSPPTQSPPTSAPPTPFPQTPSPPTSAPPTPAPPTPSPPTPSPPTPSPPTPSPETSSPPTPAPSTLVPETSAPNTSVPTEVPSLALPEEEDDSAFAGVVFPVIIAVVGCLVVAGVVGYCVLKNRRVDFKTAGDSHEFDNVHMNASGFCDDILMGGDMADGVQHDEYGSANEFALL